jgi:molybdopterin converting factor subunit 1
MIRGKVKFFASLREATGRQEIEWKLADGATVETLAAHLRKTLPGLDKWINRMWIAVNRRYAAPETVLQDGDEVALFPPVSGG